MWKRTISSKIYLWNKTRSGACAAPVPRTRGIAPGPNLRRRRLLLHSSFRMLLGRTGREPTGAMKTKKRAAERMHSLTASFLSFSPDAKHPAVGVSHRPTRGWLCHTQFAKMQSSFAKGFLRGPQCGHPIRKVSIVHLRKIVCVVLCFTGELYERYSLLHPELGPGHCPGAGVKPRIVSPHSISMV